MVTLKSKALQTIDYATVPADPATVGMLESLKAKVNNPDIDKIGETCWQANWVMVQPCVSDSVQDKTQCRIWLPVTVRDWNKSTTLYMREKAALALTNLSAQDFLVAATNGSLEFPLLSSIKVVRKVKPLDQEATDFDRQAGFQIDLHIVEAEEQNLAETITKATTPLLQILRKRPSMGSTSHFMPGCLDMLRSSTTYPLAVQYGTSEPVPCTKVIWLGNAYCVQYEEGLLGTKPTRRGPGDMAGQRLLCTIPL